MKGFVARAMQIALMTSEQIEKTHQLEKLRDYAIPNGNIQELFHLRTIRESNGLPEDNELMGKHNFRIEMDLKKFGIYKIAEANELDLDWLHGYDWDVYNKAHEINWNYLGIEKSKTRGLMSRLTNMNTLGCFL